MEIDAKCAVLGPLAGEDFRLRLRNVSKRRMRIRSNADAEADTSYRHQTVRVFHVRRERFVVIMVL